MIRFEFAAGLLGLAAVLGILNRHFGLSILYGLAAGACLIAAMVLEPHGP